MKLRIPAFLLVISVTLALAGCSSWSRQEQGAAYGALGGAGLGALIGAASGSWAWGAVIGAAGGALAGYVIADATAPTMPAGHPSSGASEVTFKRAQSQEYLAKANASRTTAESEYYLRKSIDAYPTPAAYNNLGLVELQRGNPERARALWRKALDLDPEFRPAKENLARNEGAGQ